jgi:hypothetical protein
VPFYTIRTYHLADVEARSEAVTLGIMMLQEASLTFGIRLPWPQSLLDFFSWVSSLFSFNIAFSGPECLGDGSGGYSARWATNAMSPVALFLFHVIVFCIRYLLTGGDEEKKARVFWQGRGSFVLWTKLIFMMMMQLAFDNMKWSTPDNSPVGTSARLDADPSIDCPSLARDNYVLSDFATYSIITMVGAGLLLPVAGCLVCASRVKDKEEQKCGRGFFLLLACPGTLIFLVGLVGLMVTTPYGALLGGSIIIFLIFFVGFVGGSAFVITSGDREDTEFRVLMLPPAATLPSTTNASFSSVSPLSSGQVWLSLPRL